MEQNNSSDKERDLMADADVLEVPRTITAKGYDWEESDDEDDDDDD